MYLVWSERFKNSLESPYRLARSRTLDFHSKNRGSNPRGVANINRLLGGFFMAGTLRDEKPGGVRIRRVSAVDAVRRSEWKEDETKSPSNPRWVAKYTKAAIYGGFCLFEGFICGREPRSAKEDALVSEWETPHRGGLEASASR